MELLLNAGVAAFFLLFYLTYILYYKFLKKSKKIFYLVREVGFEPTSRSDGIWSHHVCQFHHSRKNRSQSVPQPPKNHKGVFMLYILNNLYPAAISKRKTIEIFLSFSRGRRTNLYLNAFPNAETLPLAWHSNVVWRIFSFVLKHMSIHNASQKSPNSFLFLNNSSKQA